jgi:hypothetical protein
MQAEQKRQKKKMQALWNAIESFAKDNGADDTVAAVIPWFLLWHALYWVSVIISPICFETYSKLDGPMKSYWAASMVCGCECLS